MKSDVIRIETGGYTSIRNAEKYVRKGRAVITLIDGIQTLCFNAKWVDISIKANQPTSTYDPVKDHFRWRGKPSAGFQVMQAVRT